MTCCNSCFHCNVHGSGTYKNAHFEDIQKVLQQISNFKNQNQEPATLFQFFYEPTCHPAFLDIMELTYDKDLIYQGFFQPTNGFGFQKYTHTDITRLKSIGIDHLQLTFYGLKETHNRMACNRNAYDNLITTVRKCKEADLEVACGLIVHKDNLDEFEAAKSQLIKLGLGDSNMKWFLYSSDGRGLSDEFRITIDELKQICSSDRIFTRFNSEKSFIDKISKDLTLCNQTVFNKNGCFVDKSSSNLACEFWSFSILNDGGVYFGGLCDSQPPLFFELKEEYYLGNLLDDDLNNIIERSIISPPELLTNLQQLTWGELLEKYGDSNNEYVYEMYSLVRNKWTSLFLRDNYV